MYLVYTSTATYPFYFLANLTFNSTCFSTNIHATPPTFGSWNNAKAINKFTCSVAESVEV